MTRIFFADRPDISRPTPCHTAAQSVQQDFANGDGILEQAAIEPLIRS
jgi:hypothetical protein